MSSCMLTWWLHENIIHFLWAYLTHGDSFKTITLRILLRTTPTKVECLSSKINIVTISIIIVVVVIIIIIIIIIIISSSSSSSSVNNY